MVYFWYYAEKSGRSSKLVTEDEYLDQKSTGTQEALLALQTYLNDHPEEIDKVRGDNEVFVSRFCRGKNHLSRDERDMKQEPVKQGWIAWCLRRN